MPSRIIKTNDNFRSAKFTSQFLQMTSQSQMLIPRYSSSSFHQTPWPLKASPPISYLFPRVSETGQSSMLSSSREWQNSVRNIWRRLRSSFTSFPSTSIPWTLTSCPWNSIIRSERLWMVTWPVSTLQQLLSQSESTLNSIQKSLKRTWLLMSSFSFWFYLIVKVARPDRRHPHGERQGGGRQARVWHHEADHAPWGLGGKGAGKEQNWLSTQRSNQSSCSNQQADTDWQVSC